jgi:ParB/RepB/Spo0J family partition protein
MARKPTGKSVTGETGVTTELVPAVAPPAALLGTAVTMWPVAHLAEYPDNPRHVRTQTQKFRELTESIRTNGVIEPLTVRRMPPGVPLRAGMESLWRQVLSGHRRLAAALLVGLPEVPVRDLGEIDDALAFDIVAMGNLHEDLTPLEEGARVSTWLDKYHEDATAVASRLGRSPHWVAIHAQIHRGLSADWRKVLADAGGVDQDQASDRAGPQWSKIVDVWTAEHWARVARLSARAQAETLSKFQKDDYYWDAYEWTVRDLENELKVDLLYLNKAPFATGAGSKCETCLDRTGVQPLLFGEAPEDASGGKERCLHPKCWAAQTAKALGADFRRQAAEYAESYVAPVKKGGKRPNGGGMCTVRAEDVVPVCLAVPPQGYNPSRQRAYNEKVRPAKNGLQNLVMADRVSVVKEGTSGAVPGVVVVGDKGHRAGARVWVKIQAQKAAAGSRGHQPTAKELAKAAENDRWAAAVRRIADQVAQAARPSSDVQTLLLGEMLGAYQNDFPKLRRLAQRDEAAILAYLAAVKWRQLQAEAKDRVKWASAYDRPRWSLLGAQLSIDAQAIYDELKAQEKTPAAPAAEKEKKKGEGKGTGTAKGRLVSKTGGACAGDPATCEVGCRPCLAEKKENDEDLVEDLGDAEELGEE